MCVSSLWLLIYVLENWWLVERNRATTDDRKCSCKRPAGIESQIFSQGRTVEKRFSVEIITFNKSESMKRRSIRWPFGSLNRTPTVCGLFGSGSEGTCEANSIFSRAMSC